MLALALQACCQHWPDSYPPPEQRHPLEGNLPLRASLMLNMNDAGAETHFVQDIGLKLEGGQWRWAQRRPPSKSCW